MSFSVNHIFQNETQTVYTNILFFLLLYLSTCTFIQVTIYNGLRDTGVPHQGAEKWIQTIGNGTIQHRRKWSSLSVGGGSNQTLGEQVAGYVTNYANNITFVTLIGAGHLSPGERPASAYQMISSFLRHESLPKYNGPVCPKNKIWLGRGWADFQC